MADSLDVTGGRDTEKVTEGRTKGRREEKERLGDWKNLFGGEKEILKITSRNGYIASILTILMSDLFDLVPLNFAKFLAIYAFRFAKYLLLAAEL